MGIQIVMDRSGDTRHEFDSADAKAVALAERRFKDLTGKGFRAVALDKDGGPGHVAFVARETLGLRMPQAA